MKLLLRKYRQRKGLNQEQLAQKIGTTRRVVSAYEREETPIPLEVACRMTDVLEITLDELVGREREDHMADPYERELIENYRSSTPERQDRLIDTARDFAAMSKDAAKRDELSSPQVSA